MIIPLEMWTASSHTFPFLMVLQITGFLISVNLCYIFTELPEAKCVALITEISLLLLLLFKSIGCWVVVVHSFTPSTWEADAL